MLHVDFPFIPKIVAFGSVALNGIMTVVTRSKLAALGPITSKWLQFNPYGLQYNLSERI